MDTVSNCFRYTTTSEKLELDLFNSYRQGAFAGEFFNPNIGVKKRGFCKRKAPLTDKRHALSKKNLPLGGFFAVCAGFADYR